MDWRQISLPALLRYASQKMGMAALLLPKRSKKMKNAQDMAYLGGENNRFKYVLPHPLFFLVN